VIAYVDASVLLRLALGQPDALREWRDIHQGISSALIAVESLRTLDRLRIRAKFTDSEVASRRASVIKMIASLEIVEITSPVLERAHNDRPVLSNSHPKASGVAYALWAKTNL
jgi:predicted nucleic acid-binding protein